MSHVEGGRKIDLYLILGYGCNFRCGHCLNDSSPERFAEVLTQSEINKVASEINKNNDVRKVVFLGGEPSLYIKTIELIQELITRDVLFEMATNASWGNRSSAILNKIKLNSVVISFDKFHEPFIKVEQIKKFAAKLSACEIDISLAPVYETEKELADTFRLGKTLNISVNPSRLSIGGRAHELLPVTQEKPNLSSYQNVSGCPAFQKFKDDETEGVSYLPKEGFTICCGTLSYADPSSKSHYSDTLKGALATSLAETHRTKSIYKQVQSLGLNENEIPSRTRCDACSALYKKEENGLSLSETATIASRSGMFLKTLPQDWQKALLPNFSIRHFLSCSISNELIESPEALSADPFKVSKIHSQQQWEEFLSHFDRISAEASREMSKVFQSSLKKFENLWPSQVTDGIFFSRQENPDKIVASILIYGPISYPDLNLDKCLVITWVGIEKKASCKEDSRKIKDYIVGYLKSEYPDRQLVAIVDHMNLKSLTFFKKLGFATAGIKIEK